MGMFKGALKTGIAMKALEIVRREAAKPQNQARARQLFDRATKGGSRGGTGTARPTRRRG